MIETKYAIIVLVVDGVTTTYYVNTMHMEKITPISSSNAIKIMMCSDFVVRDNRIIKSRQDINVLISRSLGLNEPEVKDTVQHQPKTLVCPFTTQKNLIKLRDDILKMEPELRSIFDPIVQIRLKINSCLYRE